MKKKKYIFYCFIFISFLGKAQKPLLQWVKTMGGASVSTSSPIFAIDNANNFYLTGNFAGTVDFNPGIGVTNLTSVGGNDAYIVKLDAMGTFVWAKSFGGTGNESSSNISVDPSGNVYTTGSFSLTADFDPSAGTYTLSSSGLEDIFILKLDASGNFVWAKSMGSTDTDFGYSLALDPSGNIHVTGNFVGTVDFDPNAGVVNLTSNGLWDVFVIKIDPTGNLTWAKSIGGNGDEFGNAIIVDGTGNVHITGDFANTVDFDPSVGTYSLSSAGLADIFILKLDGLGNFVWAKNMGGTSSDFTYAIKLDPSGNVYSTGAFNLTADFDPNVGVSNLISSGSNDIFILKLDNNGNFLWAKNMGGSGDDFGYSIDLDASGNVYTSGAFNSTADFDPSASSYTLTSSGLRDAYISKLDPTGAFVWAKSMGSTSDDYAISLKTWANDAIYTSGKFAGTVDFDPNVGIKNITSIGTGDAFIHKMIQCNLKSMDGSVSGSTGGNVILYQYIPTLSKWDSVAFTPYTSTYSFGIVDSSSYVLKAVPTATTEQVTYFGNAISWKTATVVNHGCINNTTNGFDKKTFGGVFNPTVPGTPIGGVVVKGGKNPGGQMFVQTITDPVTGTYTLSGIPDGTSYFVLVDIPGLDTNLTYHRNLIGSNNQITGLDFTVDSIFVNPVPNIIGINDLNIKEYQLVVYPNPTYNQININYSLKETSKVNIELFDILGKSVKTLLPTTQQHTDSYKTSWQLGDLNPGLYFIKININGAQSTIKISVTN
jgi:hypothetical protein